MCNVFTVGYEGRNVEEFIDLLTSNDIKQLIDVREIPISRKPGFSKKKLSELLESAGIKYVHIKELGSPKEIREELYQTHDYISFFEKYRFYVQTHFSYIQTAWEYVTDQPTCLMCFEKKATECHRSVITEFLINVMPSVDGVINL